MFTLKVSWDIFYNNWLDGWLLPEQTCYRWFKQHNVCLKKRCNVLIWPN